jgi:hypothetical protein
MKAGFMIAGVVLLASCGGHDDNNVNQAPPPNPPSPPVSMTDKFFAYVSELVNSPAAQADTTQPVDISRVSVTEPDNTKPEPLKK